MTWLSWMIVILPVLGVLFAAFYSKRYVKDVADYLACGRVAGRYVISVGDMAAGLSVISLVAACEANYQVGIAYHFWGVYYYITTIVASLLVGCVSTVWFMWGGFRDMVAMFRDLAARVANPLDDGRVVGHVSLADKEHFEEVEETAKEDETEPKA